MRANFLWQAHYWVRLEDGSTLYDVSYVARINHESPFSWQAQYLVRLGGDSCCSARK